MVFRELHGHELLRQLDHLRLLRRKSLESPTLASLCSAFAAGYVAAPSFSCLASPSRQQAETILHTVFLGPLPVSCSQLSYFLSSSVNDADSDVHMDGLDDVILRHKRGTDENDAEFIDGKGIVGVVIRGPDKIVDVVNSNIDVENAVNMVYATVSSLLVPSRWPGLNLTWVSVGQPCVEETARKQLETLTNALRKFGLSILPYSLIRRKPSVIDDRIMSNKSVAVNNVSVVNREQNSNAAVLEISDQILDTELTWIGMTELDSYWSCSWRAVARVKCSGPLFLACLRGRRCLVLNSVLNPSILYGLQYSNPTFAHFVQFATPVTILPIEMASGQELGSNKESSLNDPTSFALTYMDMQETWMASTKEMIKNGKKENMNGTSNTLLSKPIDIFQAQYVSALFSTVSFIATTTRRS